MKSDRSSFSYRAVCFRRLRGFNKAGSSQPGRETGRQSNTAGMKRRERHCGRMTETEEMTENRG